MLTAYLTQTQRLLQNPPASQQLYSTSDLTAYINLARGQLALEEACIRVLGTLSITSATNPYAFTSIVTSGTTGVQGVNLVRMATYNVSGGQKFIVPRPWEWYNRYLACQISIANAPPQQWSQYAQGSKGSLYFYPVPDTTYSVNLDTVCYPINLTLDTDPEAIPYPWTDAIPYYAAYFAYMSAQREDDADKMFAKYEIFATRARKLSTPEVLGDQYSQKGMTGTESQGQR